jgi:predicted nucleotidyltransferase
LNQVSEMQKTVIIQVLSERLSAFSIILFGSAAKGLLRQESDIDIAFMSNETFTSYDIFMIAQDLADQLKREVDLLDFNQASTVFQAQIVANGVLLLDEKKVVRQYAFMYSLKAYALLNEERSEIIQNSIYRKGAFNT